MTRIPTGLLLYFVAAAPLAAATLTVTNTNDDGAGSLRQAILSANGNFVADTIEFAIPGSGVHTIALASPLPAITEPVTIDGYSQTGSSPNTKPTGQGLDTVLTIEIAGTGTSSTPCLTVNAGNAEILAMVVQGLVINRCRSIRVGPGGDGALIIGNFFGTDPTGTFRPGFQDIGVFVDGADGVVIGGATPFERNLLSGYDNAGVVADHTVGTVVRGNLIGTNAAGMVAVAESSNGIVIGSNASVTIGGTAAAHRNVISGNGRGIGISGDATILGNAIGTDVTGLRRLGNTDGINVFNNGVALIEGNVIAANARNGILGLGSVSTVVVQGNFIGTDEAVALDLGNGESGISVFFGGAWEIGGLAPGQANVIAHNGQRGEIPAFAFPGGIVVGDADGVRIRGNRIFDNRPLGIDLLAESGARGVTRNDPFDSDTGANNLQNYPLITSVVPGASTTHIEGRLNSTASTIFDIDLFSNPACLPRPQNYFQGETYLGSIPVTTDGSGNATFAADVPFVVGAGETVTATATDPAGNTSEFSPRILFSTDPPSGPSAGGVASTLTGMLFEPGATVTVGGVAATNVIVAGPTTITATMPARPAGSVSDVTVFVPSGLVGTLRNGWVANFLDVPGGHPFHERVTRLVRNGISAGIGGGLYGPNLPISRAQMAVFLVKARYGICFVPPPATGAVFSDVPAGSFAAAHIEQIARDGVTAGCGGGKFCPNDTVTRGQMALFLLKTLLGSAFLPPDPTGIFSDVPVSHPFARWVEELSRRFITAGCGGDNYCPAADNTRGEMAVFLGKTFTLE